MIYQVKTPILGFEQTESVKFEKIDEMTAKITDTKNPDISFTLINPYALREYSFDVPTPVQVLLEMDQKSKINVYNILVLQKPVEKSLVNFLAPLLFNEDNGMMGQAVLSGKEYPDFGVSVEIESFMKTEDQAS
jgi:flagellar assembly factor FliW